MPETLAPRDVGPVHVWFLVLPETLLLDIAGPAEAFRLANQRCAQHGAEPLFRLHYIGPAAAMTSSVGLGLAALEPLPQALPAPSWLLLLGRPGEAGEVVRATPPWLATRQWLAQAVAPALFGAGSQPPLRLMTVCSGALLAADAGLVGTRRITTHHELLDDLAQMAPAAQVVGNRVFVEDGPLLSSAGITAGIDLALHCIAQVAGEALAAAVAQVMVVFQRRGTDDPEISPLLARRSHLHPAVHRVQNAVAQGPAEDWSLERMAEVAHVTPRHLGRLFQAHTGQSPREHVEELRLALARQALAAGLPRQQALELAGFSSDRQWRRAAERAHQEKTADPGAPAQAGQQKDIR